MDKVDVSIVVPVYNVEKYIEKCINSILNQTFDNWELILVDDGSIDKSGKLCDKYKEKDSRIKVFHKDNGGVSSARNLGISKAIGEWVTFIDSDDYILPGFIEGLYKPIVEGNDLDFVQAGCCNSVNDRIVSCNQNYKDYVGNDPLILFQKIRGLVVSKLFKLKIIRRPSYSIAPLQFDDKMKIAEDMAFTLDYILYVKNYAFSSETGYCYRIDNMNSATHSSSVLDFSINLYSYKHLYHSTMNFINKYNLLGKDINLRLTQRGEQLAAVCISLYKNKYKRISRINHLKNDFSDEELLLLSYIKSNKYKKSIFKLLANKQYILFDYILFLLFKTRLLK